MADPTEIETLREQLKERDNTISTIKERTKTYIAKLNEDHAAALAEETKARQTLESKLESAKPFFTKLKEDNAQLTAELDSLKNAAKVNTTTTITISTEVVDEYKKKVDNGLVRIAELEHSLQSQKQQSDLAAANALKELTVLRQQVNVAEQLVTSVTHELTSARTSLETITNERDAMAKVRETMINERDSAMKERDAARVSVDTISKARDTLMSRVTSLEEAVTQSKSALAVAQEQAALAKEQAHASSGATDNAIQAEKAMVALQQRVVELEQSRNQAMAELTAAKKAAQEQLTTMTAEWDEEQRRVAELEKAHVQAMKAMKDTLAEKQKGEVDGVAVAKAETLAEKNKVVELERTLEKVKADMTSFQSSMQTQRAKTEEQEKAARQRITALEDQLSAKQTALVTAQESIQRLSDANQSTAATTSQERDQALERVAKLEITLKEVTEALTTARTEATQSAQSAQQAQVVHAQIVAEKDAALEQTARLEQQLKEVQGTLTDVQTAYQQAIEQAVSLDVVNEKHAALQAVAALEVQLEKTKAELTAATTNANTLSEELQQLRIHSEKDITALKQAHAEALHAAEESAKQKLEAAKPLFLQMKENNEQLAARETELTATITQLNTELTLAHTQTKELDAQCVRMQRELAVYAEQSSTLSDMQKQLAQKDAELAELVVVRAEHEALLQIQQSDATTISTLTSQLHATEETLTHKQTELDSTQVALTAASTAHTTLLNHHQQLKASYEQTAAQLETELKETQERKLKVRSFVDDLNAEKAVLEQEKSALSAEILTLTNNVTSLENQLAKEITKLGHAKESFAMDLEQLQKEHQVQKEVLLAEMAEKETENTSLRHQLDQHTQASAEEVLAARKKVEVSGIELEGYKAKRLVARNEMIGAAQALERAHKEGSEMKQILQYSLAPLVFEQVSALEMLLSAVEFASSQLSSKRTVRLHNTANEFLSRRLGDAHRAPGDAILGANSDHSNTSLAPLTPGQHHADEETKMNHQQMFKGSSSSSAIGAVAVIGGGLEGKSAQFNNPRAGGSSGTAPPTPLTEALEQAEMLRRELNKVHAGLALLSSSVERLGEVINVDSRCCGGVFQLFSATVGGSIEGRFRGSIVGRTLASHAGGLGPGPDRRMSGGGRGYATVGSGLGLGYDDSRSGVVGVLGRSTSSEHLHTGPSSSSSGKSGAVVIPKSSGPAFSILNDEDDD